MFQDLIDQLIREGWLAAALRIIFIGLIYLFLFLVLRTTMRELAAAARAMPSGEGRAARIALVVLDPAESSLRSGEEIALEPRTSIGRLADSTVVVDDPHTSARHAELRFERGQWWLRDLGSRNGTMLNGELVRAVMGVRPSDVLQCGRVRFQIVPSFTVPGDRRSA
jgi:pSer/pThr/pTyr-binding forkhead associated (FHA) protein